MVRQLSIILVGGLFFALAWLALNYHQHQPGATLAEDREAAKDAADDAAEAGDYQPLILSSAQWKKRLTSKQFSVLRRKNTELPFHNEYWNCHKDGIYHCAGCDLPLFSSEAKFESGTGWPSFFQPVAKGALQTVIDTSEDEVRTEVLCRKCGGHLGHVFSDGPNPTGLRFCMNSAAMKLKDKPPAKK